MEGLYIAKSISVKHGGDLYVSNSKTTDGGLVRLEYRLGKLRVNNDSHGVMQYNMYIRNLLVHVKIACRYGFLYNIIIFG